MGATTGAPPPPTPRKTPHHAGHLRQLPVAPTRGSLLADRAVGCVCFLRACRRWRRRAVGGELRLACLRVLQRPACARGLRVAPAAAAASAGSCLPAWSAPTGLWSTPLLSRLLSACPLGAPPPPPAARPPQGNGDRPTPAGWTAAAPLWGGRAGGGGGLSYLCQQRLRQKASRSLQSGRSISRTAPSPPPPPHTGHSPSPFLCSGEPFLSPFLPSVLQYGS